MLSKTAVNKAGNLLRSGDVQGAKPIINEWRKLHSYPMQHIYTTLNRCNNNIITEQLKGIVTQRLKRFASIQEKVVRFPDMNLSRMQDIGGCRVILPGMNELMEATKQTMTDSFEKIRVSDYITNPNKDSGYRGIHHIYRYLGQEYEGVFLEVQYRTSLQHLWATAVEMFSVGEPFNVKTGTNVNENVKKFFRLVSSVFALEEGQPIVPGTPNDKRELAGEIFQLIQSESIITRLRAKRFSCDDAKNKKKGVYLLALNNHVKPTVLNVYYFDNYDSALPAYENSENDPNIDVVLVELGDLGTIRKAYPNYVMDIDNFINKIHHFINNSVKETFK